MLIRERPKRLITGFGSSLDNSFNLLPSPAAIIKAFIVLINQILITSNNYKFSMANLIAPRTVLVTITLSSFDLAMFLIASPQRTGCVTPMIIFRTPASANVVFVDSRKSKEQKISMLPNAVTERGFKKKDHRRRPYTGMGRKRFYLCPKEMLQPEDMPDGWGLLWATEGQIRLKNSDDLINKEDFEIDQYKEMQMLIHNYRLVRLGVMIVPMEK